MKLLYFLSTLLISSSIICYSQCINWGFTAQGGFSYTSLNFHDTEAEFNIHYYTDVRPGFSFQCGGLGRHQFTNTSGISAGLNYLFMQTHNTITVMPSYNLDSTSSATGTYSTTVNYLSLPLQYTYTKGSFTLLGGIQPGLYLFGKETGDMTSYMLDSTYHFHMDGTPAVARFAFGLTAGVEKRISSKISIGISAYHSLVNILSQYSTFDKRKSTNVLVGVNFYPWAESCMR